MFKFEWDEQKAASNLQKHGVSFDQAVSVFADDLALTFAESDHFESEERSRHLRHLKQGATHRAGPHGAAPQYSNHQRKKGDAV